MQASNRPKGGSWRVAVCALARNDVVLFGAPITLNYNFSHETDTDFRMAEMAPFSSRDTWAWEMPRTPATSIWVFPS